MGDKTNNDEYVRKAVEVVHDELRRRKWNQTSLREMLPARSWSRIQKFFAPNGRASRATVQEVCDVLEIDHRRIEQEIGVAPLEKGGYRRQDVQKYEGYYAFIYPTHDHPDFITSHELQFLWSEQRKCLVFGGWDDGFKDRKTVAEVSIPPSGDYLSFSLNLGAATSGYTSLCIVSRVATREHRELFGLMLTLGYPKKNSYIPMSMPVALLGIQKDKPGSYQTGLLQRSSMFFDLYRAKLNSVFKDGFAISKGEIV